MFTMVHGNKSSVHHLFTRINDLSSLGTRDMWKCTTATVMLAAGIVWHTWRRALHLKAH